HLFSSWLASVPQTAHSAAAWQIGQRSFEVPDAEERSLCSIVYPSKKSAGRRNASSSAEWPAIVRRILEGPHGLSPRVVGPADDGERDGPGARGRDLVRQRPVARAQPGGRWIRLGDPEDRR